MAESTKLKSSFSDFIGIFSAVVCMLHCLAGPILIGATHHFRKEFEAVLAPEWNYLFLAIGLVAVWISSRHTHTRWLKWLLWFTYALLAMALLLEEFAHHFHGLIYLASIGLISAHLINLLKGRQS